MGCWFLLSFWDLLLHSWGPVWELFLSQWVFSIKCNNYKQRWHSNQRSIKKSKLKQRLYPFYFKSIFPTCCFHVFILIDPHHILLMHRMHHEVTGYGSFLVWIIILSHGWILALWFVYDSIIDMATGRIVCICVVAKFDKIYSYEQ